MIRYISEPKEKPFFVYLSYYTVHLPLQAKAEKIAKYRRKLSRAVPADSSFVKKGETYHKLVQDIPAYAAMVESLDENIGRLLDTLHRSGLDERTIVVFTSDNGEIGRAHV